MTDTRQPSGIARIVRFMAIAAGLAILAGACSSGDGDGGTTAGTDAVNLGAPIDEGPATPGGNLRVAVGADIDGLRPIDARWSLEGNLIASSLYDTLMTFDEERNLVPRLAESVTPNEDGTLWTITIRPDVTFHDGTPLDAEAVKLNIEARKAIPITGTALRPIETVTATGPLTVEVAMNTPWFGYDYTLAAQGGYMAAPATIAAPDGRTPIGTGPFELDGTWQPGAPINVTRNESYWDTAAYLDSIEFVTILDQTSRAASLRSGDVDMILTQDPDSVKAFRDAPGFIQVEDFAAEETFAMPNFSQAPFDNIHARKALAYATNRQAINDAIGGGIQIDADQPYLDSERYYITESGYPAYDPARATEEIELYKADTGASSLSFTISSPASNQQAAEAELLQAQWSEVGMDVTIDTLEQGAFLAGMFTGDFQLAMFRNFAYVNPDSNYIFWHSSYASDEGGINFGQLRSDEVDAALDTARATTDPDTRITEIGQAVKAINEVVGYVWLYHNDWGLAATDQVGGLSEPQRLGFARQDGKPWWPAIWLQQ